MKESVGGQEPTGVIAIAQFPDGRVLASASDFELQGYGGFTLHESQESRLKHALSRKVVDKLCSEYVFKALTGYQCRDIWQTLIKAGFQEYYIRIGTDRK